MCHLKKIGPGLTIEDMKPTTEADDLSEYGLS